MKKRLLISGIVALSAALAGAGYHQYLDLRRQAGLDTGFPAVVGVPPDAAEANLPSYAGPHPRFTSRPQDPFPYPIPFGQIGPQYPLFSGPPQYPFLCQTLDSRLGQPIVDNQQGWGVPVYKDPEHPQASTIVGYSKDCQIPTRLHYYSYSNDQIGLPDRLDIHLHPDGTLPTQSPELETTPDLLVRTESGTINRYLYSIMMPTSTSDSPAEPDLSLWNGRLVYFFHGGINVGFQQGKMRMDRLIRDIRHLLEEGYAVAYSSATHTSNTFNITLQEDTARRLKRQFVARYGKPEFTIGFGGSGGGLQQYLLAQNAPGLLDGGVALIAYPDMVTQVHYTLDCELLEYYFDELASDPGFWRDPSNREAVLGLSVSDSNNAYKPPRLWWLNDVASLLRLESPAPRPPSTECNVGWRGSPPLIQNPAFHKQWQRFDRSVRDTGQWTYWQDNKITYGTGADGVAHSPWSNVGVQYGLKALKQGVIQPEQFLELNARIGSWKPAQEMTPPRLWHVSGDSRLYRMTPYGEHNMTHSGDEMDVAPRSAGPLAAAKAAYHSGHVYLGHLDIPIMDVRMYLDHEQNIHHTWAALSIRERLKEAGSDLRLSPLWITTKPYNPMFDAVTVMDAWLTNAEVDGDLINSRPVAATDSCFTAEGDVIANGDGVWDGEWNHQPLGRCSQEMPFHKGSRQVAGDSIAGMTFQCSRVSVSDAIRTGMYGDLDMSNYRSELEQIFPDGVCDYSLPDLARPENLLDYQMAEQPVFSHQPDKLSAQ
ncbi:MAG: hypothetical protein CMI09_07445 [Oceanospirillaceae bacterium]|nr:hypothetical protein [Oceanospirillaceae bacterium]